MLISSTLTRVDLENIASDFLFEQWEARHRIEVRALAEMIECATHSGWGKFLREFAPAELQTGTDGAAAFHDCVEMYRAKHAISEAELTAAVSAFRLMDSDAPARFVEGVKRHLAINDASAPPTLKAQAVQRHAEALRDQTAAVEVVRVTNGAIKALRKECADARRFTPADKHAVSALVVRQVAEKAVLSTANDAVRAAKAEIKDAAIAEVRARRRAV